MSTNDDGLGCRAQGHFASPFVDGELPPAEMERFAAHLDGCDACKRLTEDYELLDRAARPAVPQPREADWQRAWRGIHAEIEADRRAAAESPLAGVAAWWGRVRPPSLPAVVRPVLYVAAALLLAGVLFTVQRGVAPVEEEGAVARARPGGVEVESIVCQAPDYMPIVYSVGDDDPITVVQCAFVGADT